MRSTGNYVISTTLGESVQAFVPHALPQTKPARAAECYVDTNRIAELALARRCGRGDQLPRPIDALPGTAAHDAEAQKWFRVL